MTAIRTRRFWVIGTVAAGWLVAAALLWQTVVPEGLRLRDISASEDFSASYLARSGRYQDFLRWNWLAATVIELVVLVLFVRFGRRFRLRGIMEGVALGVMALVAVWLAGLPFVLAAQWWRRRYDVSDAGYGTILVDPWLQRLGTLAAAAAAIAFFMALARRLGDRWWLVGGPAFGVVGAAFVLVLPFLLAPRLAPLRDRAVVRDVQTLAREQGVGHVDVEVYDASRRTKAINAEFYGLGPSKRIIIWDTALARLTRPQLRALVSHELGHVEAHHVWKGVGWLFLFALPGAYLVAVVTRGRGGLGEPAAVPLALLAVALLELAILPATNAISRRYEREADWHSLETTRNPQAFEGLIVKLTEASLAQPDPPRAVHVLLGTHPTPMQRIQLARSLRAEALPGGS